MPRRLILVDAALEGLGGHYLDYAKSTLEAATSRGLDTVLVTHQSTNLIDIEGHHVVRGLSRSYWQNFFATADADASFFKDTRRFASRALGSAWGESWRDRLSRPLIWAAMAALTPYGLFLATTERFTSLHFNRAAKRLSVDLSQVLKELGGARAGDLIFFPSASAVELLAVAKLCRAHGGAHADFALLFRRDPDCEVVADRSVLPRRRSRLAMAARQVPHGAPVRLYSDTLPLARRYEDIVRYPVRVAPIPVHGGLMSAMDRDDRDLVITYLGDARLEKGFHLLPEIAKASPQNVLFRVQSNISGSGEQECVLAKAALQENPKVELLAGPFSAAEYRSLMATTDVVILPYEPEAYRRRSSGVFVEALANGVPVIVSAGTWMADQLNACEGEAGLVADAEPEAFAKAIERFSLRAIDFESASKALSKEWAASHSGAALIDVLCSAFLPEPERLSGGLK